MFNEYHTWNVAALCHSVCVVQFVRQERLMCNCICMNTRLCLYSGLPIWIARFYQAASLYLYCISVQSVLLRCGLQDKLSQEGATSRPKKMSLSVLSLRFYLECSDLVSLQSTWTIDTSNELMRASRWDFGRVREEGINALIRGFHVTGVTHSFPMKLTPVYCVYSDKKNAYLRMNIGLGELCLNGSKAVIQEASSTPHQTSINLNPSCCSNRAAVTVQGILQWCSIGFLNSVRGKAAVHWNGHHLTKV